MFGLVPWKKKNHDGGALAPFEGYRPLDQLFDRFFHDWPALSGEAGRDWHWGFDVDETEDAVVVRAEAPGFEPDDFDLQVRGNQLTLRAQKKDEAEDQKGGYRRWSRQELYRSVSLPAGVDVDKVEAKYRNGVLTVTLPRTEQGKAKRIEVKA